MPFSKQKKKVNELIDATLLSMMAYDPDTKEYQDRLAVVEKLSTLKASGQQRISLDTIVIVLGNVFVTLIVVLAERESVITSKAFSFIGRKH